MHLIEKNRLNIPIILKVTEQKLHGWIHKVAYP